MSIYAFTKEPGCSFLFILKVIFINEYKKIIRLSDAKDLLSIRHEANPITRS